MPANRRRKSARDPAPEHPGTLDPAPGKPEEPAASSRSQQLQEPAEAPRRFESSIVVSPSQSGVSRAVRTDDVPASDFRARDVSRDDPIGADVHRGRNLLELARQGSVADCDSRLDEARNSFERAAQREPTAARGWCGMSEALRARASFSDPAGARPLLDRALETSARGLTAVGDDVARSELQHDRALTQLALASLVQAADRTAAEDEAIRSLERATEADPRNAAAWQTWAELACSRARYAPPERARELYAGAFELLTSGLAHARDHGAESQLHDRRGLVTLAAASLESGSERARRFDEASADFKRACDEDARNVEAYRHWAGVFDARARRASAPEAALELWKQADDVLDSALHRLPLGAATAALLTDRGDMFVAQAKRSSGSDRRLAFERATACFEEATQLAPSYGPAWQSWSLGLVARARYDRTTDPVTCLRPALVRARSAAEASPLDRRGAVWIELALSLRPLAERALSLADPFIDELSDQLGRAIAEEPRHAARYLLARGNLLRDAGRYLEAEADFDRGRRSSPQRDALACQHNLSDLLESLGREGAHREWRRTLQAYEQYAATHDDPSITGYWGIVLHAFSGECAEAEVKLSEALARRAEPASAFHAALATIAEERAELEPEGPAASLAAERIRAAERFARTGELDPHERELRLGELALRGGEPERARQQFERALDRDRDSARAHEGLGRCALRENKLEQARRHFEEATVAAPRELSPRLQLAAALGRAGDHGASAAEYRKVLAFCPTHASALLGLTEASLREADATAEHERYDAAVQAASAAISSKGRRLRAAELSRVYHARGTAQVRLAGLEGQFLGVDRYGLARADFRRAVRLDRRNEASRRALDRVTAAMRGTTVSRLPSIASGTLCVLATGLFAIAQLSYYGAFSTAAEPLSFGGYLALSFGALLFLAAGAYLPQLLRRTVSGIDVEAAPIDIGVEWRVRFER